MESIAENTCELLARGQELVVAKIVGQTGSAPRTVGSQMLITADGYHSGTIGGGLLEAQVIEKGVELLNGGIRQRFLSIDLSQKEVASAGMICGGFVEIFLDHICPTEENIALFRLWLESLNGPENIFLITAVGRDRAERETIDRCVIRADGSIHGKIHPDDELEKLFREIRLVPSMKAHRLKRHTVIVESSKKIKTVFLFGAGHVAQPTAKIAAMVGFQVVVLDDRKQFASLFRFPEAHDVIVIEDFDRALNNLTVDENSFIVILTRGHRHDRTVLAQALKSQAGYIGMIGSRRKRDAIFTALLQDGFTENDLSRVHSPIGVAIDAETPEEIAVSIVAEMIQKRSQKIR
jgi:xanthine dehydrogenase accessory factor